MSGREFLSTLLEEQMMRYKITGDVFLGGLVLIVATLVTISISRTNSAEQACAKVDGHFFKTHSKTLCLKKEAVHATNNKE